AIGEHHHASQAQPGHNKAKQELSVDGEFHRQGGSTEFLRKFSRPDHACPVPTGARISRGPALSCWRPELALASLRLRSALTVQGEADLDGYLPMGDLAVSDMTARFHYLEPLQPMQRQGCLGNRGLDSILNAGLG